MSGRIENLGDYNKARLMLQKRGGDLSALIKDIKNVGARARLSARAEPLLPAKYQRASKPTESFEIRNSKKN